MDTDGQGATHQRRRRPQTGAGIGAGTNDEREGEHKEWARTLSEPITVRSPALTVAALQALGDMSEVGEALEWLDEQR